jgi:hypothetical protein
MKYNKYLMRMMSFTLFLSVYFLISLIYFPSSSAFGESKVVVSQSCGPEEGFNTNIIGKNFAPNSSVSWVLFDANLNPKLNGYFATDNTGSFKEITYMDDLPIGKYTMFFFDDSDINYMYDNEQSISQIPISIPCPIK